MAPKRYIKLSDVCGCPDDGADLRTPSFSPAAPPALNMERPSGVPEVISPEVHHAGGQAVVQHAVAPKTDGQSEVKTRVVEMAVQHH